MVMQRQSLGILHGPDARMRQRIDHEGARGADRIGMAGTVLGKRRRKAQRGEREHSQYTEPDADLTATNHR
jgi:hypothetical protein